MLLITKKSEKNIERFSNTVKNVYFEHARTETENQPNEIFSKNFSSLIITNNGKVETEYIDDVVRWTYR